MFLPLLSHAAPGWLTYQLLSAILDHAVTDSKIARNPVVGVDLPRMAITPRRYPTHEQVSDLADACKGSGTLVLVLAYCGSRWGEAAALPVGRIDLLRGRLEVVEAVVDVKGHMVFGSPKSHQHRSGPVPKFLHEDLKAAMAGQGRGSWCSHRRKTRCFGCRTSGLVGSTALPSH